MCLPKWLVRWQSLHKALVEHRVRNPEVFDLGQTHGKAGILLNLATHLELMVEVFLRTSLST